LRILFFHCKKLEFIDKRKSNRPSGISDTGQSIENQLFENVLAAFICVEKCDNSDKIEDYCNIIINHLNLINRNFVAVIPFAHLSKFIADHKDALTLLEKIIVKLRKKGVNVGVSSFGFHKEFELIPIDYIHCYGHPGSVAFRRFPDNNEMEFVNLVKELGIERCEQLLIQLRTQKND
jgi:hypothetical protein